jgi:hypothetical protein
MAPPVDPNRVLLTGENSFIRLSTDGGKTMTDRISHWRILWCPAGTGHALFVQSQLTGPGARVYADNVAVARWLQSTIESLLFPAFADPKLPVHHAVFDRHGDPRSSAEERVSSDEDEIVLTWYDFIEPFVLNAPPGFGGRPLGVFSTFFPARGAQVVVNGEFAPGRPWQEMRGDRQSSTACLAWSETWVQPPGQR